MARVIRQLKEVPPQAGHDIYLTLDLKLQTYIETLLAGSRAAVVVTDPRSGGILALVSMPSYNPNLFVDGISSKDYSGLLNDPNTPLINRATQGVYPPASTVKPYMAVSALSAGVITRNTSLFDPGWWQLPGSEKRYRDWEKMGPRPPQRDQIAGKNLPIPSSTRLPTTWGSTALANG
ncbi:Peptidoglycan synthase FtsI precursor [Cedecea neteri]|uniref:Peptidoglycan synthase FtsI n=1 Tax=Cedecea neteri TaxID=158822 RepID=A0A2X2TBS4_9ENTR|nr:Peptidoglycan synthase FtsI precursor [Cedecea neteri]